jgi:putative nucleotidyltransferase with HDIG domain
MANIGPDQNTYIATGDYTLAKESKLFAVLGSCVGVAIFDKHSNIGGLVHLALPEPVSDINPDNATAYASTGLPTFINTLLSEGAKGDQLEAVVAGGALTAPISQTDINLDLGGRTTDKVLEILNQNKIKIIQSDTGGYNGCTLVLDPTNWSTEIRPAIPDAVNGKRKFVKPTPLLIEQAIQKIRPIPQIALKIIRIIQKEDYNFSQLAEEIQSDQVICARILQFCNSPVIGLGRKKIDSIDRALTFFGENNLLELLIAATVNVYFIDKIGGYSLRRGGLFTHALAVGNTAKTIALSTEGVYPDVAYTAGLLHDIGKIILDEFVADLLPLFYKKMLQGEHNFIELEQMILGTDHLQAGKKLAENWSLPENITEVISLHENPSKGTIDPQLTHMVCLANLLSSWYLAGEELEQLNADIFTECLDFLDIQQPELSEIITSIHWPQFRPAEDYPRQ